MTAYLLERAWVDGAVRDDVRVEIEDGRFTSVTPDAGNHKPTSEFATPRTENTQFTQGVRHAERANHKPTSELRATQVPGLTLPGLANCHSHAFHRALRGRTQRGRGTFWTWREQMYAVAERLDPDSYFTLARATYREMAAAGITTVGEFHYLHHQPDGTPYDDPLAMRHALRAAAAEAGIRVVVLDTAYLSGGFGRPVEGVQRRFSDGDAAAWAERAGEGPAAIHSVRAVPREQLGEFQGRSPLHVHLSEQPIENEECLRAYGVTPARLLHDAGLLGPTTTVVHATHLTDEDADLVATPDIPGTNVCVTPTTERDLADGIGPMRYLADARCRLTVGSDSHAVIDLFEELRCLEGHERLDTRWRGHWTAAELLDAATGHETLGIPDAGAIAVGRRADLVTLDTRSVRTAGTGADEHSAVFAATAADVTRTLVEGRLVYQRGDDEQIGRELDQAIGAVWW